MAELVDATDLKSVGDFLRAGSIPAFRTKKIVHFERRAIFFIHLKNRIKNNFLYGDKIKN